MSGATFESQGEEAWYREDVCGEKETSGK